MFILQRVLIALVTLGSSLTLYNCGGLVEESSSGQIALVLPPNVDEATGNSSNQQNNNPINTANLDDDDDGLTNGQEATLGTNPWVADSDGDTLNDGDEVNTHLTNPLDTNTDNDDEADGFEVAHATTRDPLNADDDHDGFPGTETSAGAYGPNVNVDCDNNNMAKHPGMIDTVNGQDSNCKPDLTSSFMQFYIGGGSSVHYRVDMQLTPLSDGIFIEAEQINISNSVYECEYNNFNGTPISSNYSCSTWQNPPWYTGGQPIGFQVIKNSAWTWTVNACAKTCFNCPGFVFDCDSRMLGE